LSPPPVYPAATFSTTFTWREGKGKGVLEGVKGEEEE